MHFHVVSGPNAGPRYGIAAVNHLASWTYSSDTTGTDTIEAFRESNLASRSIYPGIAFAGGAAPPPTITGSSLPSGSPGAVLSQSCMIQDGVYTASINANRPAVVLLKGSYDSCWKVTLDGLTGQDGDMAPSLVEVAVLIGHHAVRFRYEPYDNYPLLVALGLLTLIGLALYPRRTAPSASRAAVCDSGTGCQAPADLGLRAGTRACAARPRPRGREARASR